MFVKCDESNEKGYMDSASGDGKVVQSAPAGFVELGQIFMYGMGVMYVMYFI